MTADLEPILRRLADHERIEALAITLREQHQARLHVGPALTAARPAIVAALATLSPLPLLYVVGSGDAALRAREDLCQWLEPEAVLLFPAGDALPYEPMSPGNDVIAGRLRVLRSLGDGGWVMGDGGQSSSHPPSPTPRPLVIVAPIKALLQPTLSRADWAAARIHLKRGGEHSLDDLVGRWVAMGYRVAPTVEEPGELNRRGGIVDIFPPADELPLRIEFFGDEIDSLRRFDPITQRSEAQIRDVSVGPAHEIPLWRSERAAERMRALDTAGLRREASDEWEATIARIEQGERFEGRALFAPFFWDETNDQRPKINTIPATNILRPWSFVLRLSWRTFPPAPRRSSASWRCWRSRHPSCTTTPRSAASCTSRRASCRPASRARTCSGMSCWRRPARRRWSISATTT
jgi:transcription-repair coupling factor (superfamily II helicase)